MVDIRVLQKLEVTPGGITERILFIRIDRLDGTAKIGAGAGSDFHKDQDFAAAANEIDLAPGGQEVPVENAVTLPA